MIIVRSARSRRSTKCVFEVGIALYLSAPFGPAFIAVNYKNFTKFPIDFLRNNRLYDLSGVNK